MKLVSTSSYESERSEGLQRSTKSKRETDVDIKTPDFSFSLHTLRSENKHAPKCCTFDVAISEKDTDIDPPVSNVDELAAAPVDDKSLMEGFDLFGSVFSLLQEEVSAREDHQGYELSPSGSDELSNVPHFTGRRRADDAIERDHDNFIVIDFDMARKKNSAVPDVARMQPVQTLAAVKTVGSDPVTALGLQVELRITEQRDDKGAPLGPLQTRHDRHNTEVDALMAPAPANGSSQSAALISEFQSSGDSGQRVDQITRAIVEQSAELAAVKVLTTERHAHAGLTGQTLRLSLHPSELGSVDVSVSKRGKRLQVTIVPDLESTGRLLLKDAEQLVKQLGLASASSDYVQIQIVTSDGVVEVHTGDDQLQFSARSEQGRDGDERQHAARQALQAHQQERHSSDEKVDVSRRDISDDRHDPGVYI